MTGYRLRLFFFFGLLLGAVSLFACKPQMTDELCQASNQCLQQGRCTAQETTCIATTDKDCRASRFCHNVGECTAQNGLCIATKDLDCRESIQCKENKKCIVSSGECVVLNVGYCRNGTSNPSCPSEGKCSLDSRKNECVAKTDADCSGSENCKVEGVCSVETQTGICIVKSDADCRRSDRCASKGACNLGVETNANFCIPKSHSDCIQSTGCKGKDKACALDANHTGLCINGEEYCSVRQECTDEGKCSWNTTTQRCTISSDEDCAKSLLCTLANRCTFRQGDALGPRCVRSDDDSCVSTTSCLTEGRCSSSTSGKCIASSNSDCLLSLKCREQGFCLADTQTKTCKVPTKCFEDKELKINLCPCAGTVCDVYGRCKLKDAVCIPTDDDDCAKSQNCREKGLCKKQGSSCAQGGTPIPNP